jgi:tRNA (cytidine/uridine-2'-O-)-methyltransferase
VETQDVTGGSDDKLRFRPLASPLDVVLIEPEIPQNTGSIARTCAATGSRLHLVGTLGFSIDEHAVKRAGLDYWDKVEVRTWETFEAYVGAMRPRRILLFSSRGKVPYTKAPFEEGCCLVFGKETAGLPQEILEKYPGALFGIPTLPAIRSLNLSNAVSIVVYECLGSLGAFDGM